MSEIIYNKDEFEKLLVKKLDENNVSYECLGHGDWIDDNYSTVLDSFIEAFEEISNTKFS